MDKRNRRSKGFKMEWDRMGLRILILFFVCVTVNAQLLTYFAGGDDLVNLIENSTFDTDTWWEKEVPEITISDGVCKFTDVGASTFFALRRNNLLTIGADFRIVYTIKSYVSGSIKVAMGNTLGIERNANGTYEETLTCTANTNLKIIQFGGANTTLHIDDVFLYAE